MPELIETLAAAYVRHLQDRIKALECGTDASPPAVPAPSVDAGDQPSIEVLAAELERERAECSRLRLVVAQNAATIRKQHDELAAMAARAGDGVNVRQHLRRAGDELARRLHAIDGDARDTVTSLQAWAEAKARAVDDQPEPDPAA